MDQETRTTLTLIYHNLRGMAQPIRYLLHYLQLPFQEILLTPGKNPLDLEVVKNAVTYGTMELPYLVHGTKCIQSFFAIFRYLCTLTGREDLLGQNLEERAFIRQVFYNFQLTKTKQMKIFFSFGEKALQCPDSKEILRKKLMERTHEVSECAIPLVKMKLRNLNQKYIFGHITLLDFMLFQESFYQLGMFGSLEQKNCAVLEVINSLFKTDFSYFKEKNSVYLRVMRQFREAFEKEPFYAKNQEKFESYTIICPNMTKMAIQGFKNVWQGSQSYFK